MLLRCSLIALACFGFVASQTIARDRDRNGPTRESPPEAVDARNQAEAAYQQGNYSRVIELADRLLSGVPQDHPYIAYHLRASARIELGRLSGSARQVREGISDARQAIIAAGTENPWLHIPYLYGLTSLAEIEHRPEHADLAIKVAGPVLNFPVTKEYTEVDRANLYYQRGLAYAAKRDFKAAAADQAEALRLNPDHLGAYVKRAEALAGLGQNKEALAAYDKAVERFPDALLAFNDRGKYRRTSGDLDGAISDFTRCLQLDPKFAVGYINRGLCLSDQNSHQAAENDFSEALKLPLDAGTSVLAHRLRAAARLAQGEAPAAVADLAAALKASPQDATLLEERGFANFFKKDFAAATADFAKARQSDSQRSQLVAWQALAQARAGQIPEARTLLETALAGKTPPAGWNARLCRFLLDRATEEELLAAAAEIGGAEKSRRLCEAHFFIGQRQLLDGDASKAAGHFGEAVAARQSSLAACRGARYELHDFK